MELLQLRKFCHAARSGSFAATAKAFGVPPSDISQTVRRLEDELGVRLFDRQPNAVVLNSRGEAFARQTEQALRLLDGAVTAAADDGSSGEIYICVNTNRRIVMDTVEQFQRRYPAVSVRTRVFCDPTAQEFDLIVSAEDAVLTHYDRQKLLSEQLAIAVSRHSLWGAWDGQNFAALAAAPFITMGEGSSLYQLTLRLCREAGFEPHIAVQSDDPYYVRKCVELGLGVALVPLFSWQGQFGPSVVLHPLADRCRDTYLYTAPGRYLPLCAQRFRELLVAACAETLEK